MELIETLGVIMSEFNYINGTLHAEEVSLRTVSHEVGTPFYLYSSKTISGNYSQFRKALSGISHSIAYSVKANSNIAILKLLGNLGAGMDIVSSGEYLRARKAGIDGSRIVFSGVGKTEDEMAIAISGGIKQINVESEPELKLLNSVAMNLGKVVPIAVRVNPDINAFTHEKISTGKLENKFGVPYNEVVKFCQKLSNYKNVKLSGLAVHIGSQLTDLVPYRQTFEKISHLVKVLKSNGHTISILDLGGGIGISYAETGKVIDLKRYADLVKSSLGNLECEFEFEPGRLIVGNAGVLVCSVIYLKEAYERNFLIIDGAMNDLIRPAMYDAYHDVIPVKQNKKASIVKVDIVGPICETSDTFARDREFPLTQKGDLIAILCSGAYGAAMSSEYNSRPLVPEVLVKDNKFSIIRERNRIEETIARDTIPKWISQ